MAETNDKQALLVMDVQPGIVARIPDGDAYLERVRKTLEAARKAGTFTIQVVVGFRPGAPEVSPNNQSFAAIKKNADMKMTNPEPSLGAEAGDVVVTKRRVSAFTGSDLEVVLRGQETRRLVLCGIATSGVVLSTVREAADKDYKLTVLSDLCVDFDEEVHDVLTKKVFPRQAQVTMAAEWLKTL